MTGLLSHILDPDSLNPRIRSQNSGPAPPRGGCLYYLALSELQDPGILPTGYWAPHDLNRELPEPWMQQHPQILGPSPLGSSY